MTSMKLAALLPLLASTVEAGVAKPLVLRQGQPADRYDMPVDHTPFGNLGRSTMGEPGQEVVLFFDWTWANNFVNTPRCNGINDRELCMAPETSTYDFSLSSTYENATSDQWARTEWFPNHFFFTEPVAADYGYDTFPIGPVSARTVNQFSDTVWNMSSFIMPFTIVFGLSPTLPGQDESYDAAFYQQYKQGLWKSPLSSFVWCYEDSKIAACDGNDAITSFGGYRADLVKGEVFWYPLEVFPEINEISYVWDPPFYNYWATPLNEMWFDDELIPTVPASNSSAGKGALFNHATFGRGIPLTVNGYARLVELMGGELIELEDPTVVNNGEHELFQVSCENIDSYPTVKYQFAGHDKVWEVPARHYVDELEDGTCVLNARVTAEGDQFIGSFGDQFLKDKQIIFNYETNEIGLAEVKWPSC